MMESLGGMGGVQHIFAIRYCIRFMSSHSLKPQRKPGRFSGTLALFSLLHFPPGLSVRLYCLLFGGFRAPRCLFVDYYYYFFPSLVSSSAIVCCVVPRLGLGPRSNQPMLVQLGCQYPEYRLRGVKQLRCGPCTSVVFALAVATKSPQASFLADSGEFHFAVMARRPESRDFVPNA